MLRMNPFRLIRMHPDNDSPHISIYANSAEEFIQLYQGEIEKIRADQGSAALRRATDLAEKELRPGWSDGIEFPAAVFITEDFAGHIPLPFEPPTLAVSSSSFHIKPLLKWVQREHAFYLLFFEESEAILLLGSAEDLHVLEIVGNSHPEPAEDLVRDWEESFFNGYGDSQMPLLLAGKKAHVAAFREMNRYPFLVNLQGNGPEKQEDLRSLHQWALEALEPYYVLWEEELVREYQEAQLRGETSDELTEIVRLALQKRVSHLFVNERSDLWGQINYRTGRFTFHLDKQDSFDDDILDDLAEIVLFHNGRVTVLPEERMPGKNAACAILRVEESDALKGELTEDLGESLEGELN